MSDAAEFVRARGRRWTQSLAARRRALAHERELVAEGRLRRVVGLTLEAVGCEAPLGGRCLVTGSDGTRLETEVVGFSGDKLYLMPAGELHGLPAERARAAARNGFGRAGRRCAAGPGHRCDRYAAGRPRPA